MTSSKPGCYCIRLALAGVVTFLLAGIIPAHTQEASLHPVYEDVPASSQYRSHPAGLGSH